MEERKKVVIQQVGWKCIVCSFNFDSNIYEVFKGPARRKNALEHCKEKGYYVVNEEKSVCDAI